MGAPHSNLVYMNAHVHDVLLPGDQLDEGKLLHYLGLQSDMI